MSKKSTSRTKNDGDADYGSANGRSSSSEESKCILYSNLSLKEEGATGPSGDYSSTHKILTPNLDESHRNHEIQIENTHRTSESSLDEDLYGTSDAFNKNLEFLRNKLQSFNLTVIENDPHQRFEASSSDSDSQFNWQDGHLSARETSLNLTSHYQICENFRNYPSNSAKLTKPVITTIYETSECSETDKTSSSGSWKIPIKKARIKEKTPHPSEITLSSSPENVNLTSSPGRSPNKNLESTPLSSFSSVSFRSSLVLSPLSVGLDSVRNFDSVRPISENSRTGGTKSPDDGINYIVPIKRVCTRETTPRIVVPSIDGNIPSFLESLNIQPATSEMVQESRRFSQERTYSRLETLSETEEENQPERFKMFHVDVEGTHSSSKEQTYGRFKSSCEAEDEKQPSFSKPVTAQPESCKIFHAGDKETPRSSREQRHVRLKPLGEALDKNTQTWLKPRNIQAESSKMFPKKTPRFPKEQKHARSRPSSETYEESPPSFSKSVDIQPGISNETRRSPKDQRSVRLKSIFQAEDKDPSSSSKSFNTQRASPIIFRRESNETPRSSREQIYLHLKSSSEAEDNSSRTTSASWNATQRTKSESPAHSENFELALNLPSSIIGDSTPSNRTTPLEPKILDTSTRTSRTFHRSNRIAPISNSSESRPSSTKAVCSSGDQRRPHENSSLIKLYQKYYRDTSDISSNLNSTPPCLVSTCASLTSYLPSDSSEKTISRKNEQNLTSRPELSENTNLISPKPEVHNPLFSSSLDFPKLSLHSYIFPAFTQITRFPGSFILENSDDERCFDDESEESSQHCYKSKAESLLNSPTLSLVAKKKSSGHGDFASVQIETIGTDSPTDFKNAGNKRKIQSTDMSFYSVPSHITLDKEYSNENFRTSDSSSETSVDVDEKCTNCCCFNIFFSRRRPGFFT